MLLYSVRRLLSSVLVLLAASLMVFIMAAATADPLAVYRTRQPPPPPEFFAAKSAEYGLDQPVPVRYWRWLTGLLQGDFGKSIDGEPVGPELFHRLMVTGRMVTAAMILAVILAVLVGVLTAVRAHKFSDYFFTTISYMLIALPVFWFAVLLKEFVAIRFNDLVGEQVLFTIGEQSPAIETYAQGWELWKDQLLHLILPTISLAALNFAAWSRFQRASMLDVMNSDFMRLGRAKGLPHRKVLIKHGLRNALIPLTTVVALGVGLILGGAVITETVFNWHGMGDYLINDGIGQQDINVILGWLMVSAVFVVLFNLFADLLYAVLDPRIRLS
jgi:peptide/nickel transport system permease protein